MNKKWYAVHQNVCKAMERLLILANMLYPAARLVLAAGTGKEITLCGSFCSHPRRNQISHDPWPTGFPHSRASGGRRGLSALRLISQVSSASEHAARTSLCFWGPDGACSHITVTEIKSPTDEESICYDFRMEINSVFLK